MDQDSDSVCRLARQGLQDKARAVMWVFAPPPKYDKIPPNIFGKRNKMTIQFQTRNLFLKKNHLITIMLCLEVVILHPSDLNHTLF